MRVAWCPDLGGLPLDRRVRAVLEAQRTSFEALGCVVEEACPDLGGADEVFLVVRMWRSWNCSDLCSKDIGTDETGGGLGDRIRARLSAADITGAMIRHGEIMERMRRFQEKYEFMLCAVNQVPPFDATIDWPKEIEGVKMEHYWLG